MGRAVFVLLVFGLTMTAQQKPGVTQNGSATRPSLSDEQPTDPEHELQIGVQLTRSGHFREAITHLKAAEGVSSQTFTIRFDLGLCYLGIHQFDGAIGELKGLGGKPAQSAAAKNLLAQAYIGKHDETKALDAFQQAAKLTPENEKLYTFVSDACLDAGLYELGVRVTVLGLQNLPNSARLYLQKGLLRLRLDEVTAAEGDFEKARRLAPDSDIGVIAAAEEALASGNIGGAIETARKGIANGHAHYLVLTTLGEALLRAGASDAMPKELAEAQSVLERAVSVQPAYASAQLSLSKVYLLEDRTAEAIEHLEIARSLEPGNVAIYATLATAYKRAGDNESAQRILAKLHDLNAAMASTASNGHNGVVTGKAVR